MPIRNTLKALLLTTCILASLALSPGSEGRDASPEMSFTSLAVSPVQVTVITPAGG